MQVELSAPHYGVAVSVKFPSRDYFPSPLDYMQLAVNVKIETQYVLHIVFAEQGMHFKISHHPKKEVVPHSRFQTGSHGVGVAPRNLAHFTSHISHVPQNRYHKSPKASLASQSHYHLITPTRPAAAFELETNKLVDVNVSPPPAVCVTPSPSKCAAGRTSPL